MTNFVGKIGLQAIPPTIAAIADYFRTMQVEETKRQAIIANREVLIERITAEKDTLYETYKKYHAETEARLRRLGRSRADGMVVVREAIAFIKKARLVNPDIISDAEIDAESMERLDQTYGNILKDLGAGAGSVAGGAGVGALTALGAYGLVGALGTASTGAAIGGLSGAAASSATLAWLGGGALAAGGLGIAGGTAVLGGIVAAPAVIAVGVFRQVKAGKVEQESQERIQKLELEKAKLDRDRAKLRAARHLADEVDKTLRELAGQLKAVLQEASSTTEDVYRVVQLAKTLRAAIDEPVIPLGAKSG